MSVKAFPAGAFCDPVEKQSNIYDGLFHLKSSKFVLSTCKHVFKILPGTK